AWKICWIKTIRKCLASMPQGLVPTLVYARRLGCH
ncbi:uncharacterized protein METZ01_LOCUS403181, partial [marine metagenome]